METIAVQGGKNITTFLFCYPLDGRDAFESCSRLFDLLSWLAISRTVLQSRFPCILLPKAAQPSPGVSDQQAFRGRGQVRVSEVISSAHSLMATLIKEFLPSQFNKYPSSRIKYYSIGLIQSCASYIKQTASTGPGFNKIRCWPKHLSVKVETRKSATLSGARMTSQNGRSALSGRRDKQLIRRDKTVKTQ